VPDWQGLERLLVMLQMAKDGLRPVMSAPVAASRPENLAQVSIVFTRPMPRAKTGKLRRAEMRENWQRHVQVRIEVGAG
jgi:acyl-coenzyme A synthetase/AMP-(fatty) acid ligase